MRVDADRGAGLARFGYTARQAQFLVMVALHGGYFLRRHYVTFTGRPHGQAAVRFLSRAVARAHVRGWPYGRHGQVFHLCARPIYAAIGEEHNRNRRRAEWDAVRRKLMTLDFVLARPEAEFWATEEDKVSVMRELGIAPALWPAKRYLSRRVSGRATTRYFVDKMPWYREPGNARLWFAYVDAERTRSGFETFLVQYRELLAAVPSGVTYVAPQGGRGPAQAVFNKVIGSDSGRTRIPVASFREYCRLRRDIEAHQIAHLRVDALQRFVAIRARFAAPAHDDLYAAWLRDGDVALARTDPSEESASRCVLAVHELGCRGDEPRAPNLKDGQESR